METRKLTQEINFKTSTHPHVRDKILIQVDITALPLTEDLEISQEQYAPQVTVTAGIHGAEKKSLKLDQLQIASSRPTPCVFEFQVEKKEEFQINVETTIESRCFVYVRRTEEISENRDVIACYARQLMAEINSSTPNHQRKRALEATVLPLLVPVRDSDSEFVVEVRKNITDSIRIRDSNTRNSKGLLTPFQPAPKRASSTVFTSTRHDDFDPDYRSDEDTETKLTASSTLSTSTRHDDFDPDYRSGEDTEMDTITSSTSSQPQQPAQTNTKFKPLKEAREAINKEFSARMRACSNNRRWAPEKQEAEKVKLRALKEKFDLVADQIEVFDLSSQAIYCNRSTKSLTEQSSAQINNSLKEMRSAIKELDNSLLSCPQKILNGIVGFFSAAIAGLGGAVAGAIAGTKIGLLVGLPTIPLTGPVGPAVTVSTGAIAGGAIGFVAGVTAGAKIAPKLTTWGMFKSNSLKNKIHQFNNLAEKKVARKEKEVLGSRFCCK